MLLFNQECLECFCLKICNFELKNESSLATSYAGSISSTYIYVYTYIYGGYIDPGYEVASLVAIYKNRVAAPSQENHISQLLNF